MKKSAMRWATVAVLLAAANVLAGQPAGSPGPDAAVRSEPPDRPLRVTPEQIAALEQISAEPQYAVAPDTRAAYSPDAQDVATEASAVAFYFAYAGSLAWVLIAAAPL